LEARREQPPRRRLRTGLAISRAVGGAVLSNASASRVGKRLPTELQFAVTDAEAIAAVLIAVGAEVDAPCDAYEGRCPTMNLLVSSDHSTEAGVAGSWSCVLGRR